MKRFGAAFIGLAALVLAAGVAKPQGNVSLENNTNRPGSDYRNYETGADPNQCRNDCANDPTCRAFTWVRPGVQGANAHCWLKSAVPNASANNCCVSGVSAGGGGGASSAGLEVNVDRRGGDYQNFEMPGDDPNACRDACQRDGHCQSFTYLRPSYWGPRAHCFLKGSTPPATQNACCISGVLRSGGGDSNDPLDGLSPSEFGNL